MKFLRLTRLERRRRWSRPSPGLPGGASERKSVPGAAWLPVDQAVRVSTCEAQFHNLSGSQVADIGDEVPPSRRVRQHGDLVVRQLSSSASEYGVLRSLLGSSQDGSELFKDSSSMSCQVPLPQSHVASWRRSVLLSNSLSGHGFSQGCDYVVNNRSV